MHPDGGRACSEGAFGGTLMTTPGMRREVRRLLWITVVDPILDGIDVWLAAVERHLISYLTLGGAGTVPEGEVHITRGVDW